ncbi:MAG: radical SAM protein [Verrucomicrobia bacterium]|nr:radical SAM protein [Verrucomicrobiota bacterium]
MNPASLCATTAPAPTGSAAAAAWPDLSWVDEFIRRVRPYIHVRATDGLLIKRPNQAQKLNPTGVRVLAALLAGDSFDQLVERVGRDPARVRQIGLFLFEVKRFLEGNLTGANASAAVEFQPLPVNFSPLPVLAEVALTRRCQLRCRFCYGACSPEAESRASTAVQMTTAEVARVLRVIRHDAQVPSVSFTGGEPTLRGDLPELIAEAKTLDLRVNLITNGTRIDRDYARRLADAGLDSAQVSLEGVRASTHDHMTGGPGSFQRTCQAVRHLANAGLHVHTNTTITSFNLDDCPAMPRFVKNQLGRDRFSMNLVIPTGRAATDNSQQVRYREVGRVLEAILAESRRVEVEFMWYSPTPLCLFNPIPKGLGNKGCAACDGLLSVAADGSVLPCSSCPDPVGNLLREDFDAIWQSRRARAYREKRFAPPGCRACEHFAVCHGACPLYWRALGTHELPPGSRSSHHPGQDHGLAHAATEIIL